MAQTAADVRHEDDEVQSPVGIYADWIRRLRGGKQVGALPLGSEDPLAQIGHELQLLADMINRRELEVQQLFDLVLDVEHGISIEDVLDRIFASFHEVIPYDRIGCAFLSADQKHLTAFWARSDLGPLRIPAGFSQRMKGSSLQRILETGQPRILNDLEAYLKARPRSQSTRCIVEEGGRSSLTWPLIVGDHAIGFLFFTSRDKNAYEDAHLAVFRRIAAQVSVAIEKSQLYRRLIDQNVLLVQERRLLEEAASRDPVTGILNRREIERALVLTLQKAIVPRTPVGVIVADIDHFKAINDSFGHPAGDGVLREFSQRIAAVLREGDLLGRYGGEEFLIIVNKAGPDDLKKAARRLHGAICRSPFLVADVTRTVTASFGLAVSNGGARSARELVAAADAALYAAKKNGRNCIMCEWDGR